MRERLETPSIDNLEDLLRADSGDDNLLGSDSDSSDDGFGAAFNADELLNCSLNSGGGLDLSNSKGNLSFNNSRGDLSTDEGAFGVFDCDPTPSRNLVLSGEFAQHQQHESTSSCTSYNSSPSHHRASPNQQQSQDMTLEMVNRTNSLSLDSFHGPESSQNGACGGGSVSSSQQPYDGDHSNQTSNTTYDSPEQRATPARAFSFDQHITNVSQQGQQQQQRFQHQQMGDGSNSVFCNSDNTLQFGMQQQLQQRNSNHCSPPSGSYSTSTLQFHGQNFDAPMVNEMSRDDMQQRMQQFQQMQQQQLQLQQQQNNNLQLQNNMSYQLQQNNNFQMQNNMSSPQQGQMQNLNQQMFSNKVQGSGGSGDTLLGTFPQGNSVFVGIQGNVSIGGSSNQLPPNKPQFPSTTFDQQLSPAASGLKAASAPPSSMNEVMEKLSESMRRSAMSRSVVKQLSSRNLIRSNSGMGGPPNPVMMMAQKQRGLMGTTSDRSLVGDASGRSIPVRRMSNSFNAKHHIQHNGRGVHRHNSQQSLDAHSNHSITFQLDGRNMGTL